MIIDTHCHLASSRFLGEDRHDLIRRAQKAEVDKMVTLGTHVDDWVPTLEWAREFPGLVYPALGIHPNDAHEAPDDWRPHLITCATQHPLVAIGETGLDYYHPAPCGWEESDFRALQRRLLEEHFDLAEQLNLNICLHTRDAAGSQSFEDTLDIARQFAGRVRPVFHCFVGTVSQMEAVINQVNGMVSLSGIVTYSKPGNTADVACACPLSHLMVETDAPYLSPVPQRGKRNEPAYVRYTAEWIAQKRREAASTVYDCLRENSLSFFKIDLE